MPYKNNFPIFQHNPNLIYLDSGATTQKPQCVIDAEMQFYSQRYATVHRGAYRLSEGATASFEESRKKAQRFLNAKHSYEIIFTKGTTEAINLVAATYGLKNLKSGDEIILSTAEHHANIVPWQQVCEKTGSTLKIIPLNEDGSLNLEAYENAFSAKTKLVAITHISNVLGVINPVKKLIDIAHANNAVILIDGAQAVAHTKVDVQALDCDFYVLSAHKLYGPTGVGILYGKEKHLDNMPPYQFGGHMIRTVSFEKTTFTELPHKFEPGTPNIAGVIGFGAALDYVNSVSDAQKHEAELCHYALTQLNNVEGLKLYGTAPAKIPVFSFALKNIHPHDVATILDQQNIAVRAGHHCAMPLMQYLNVPALTRASFGLYNTKADVDALVAGLAKVEDIFTRSQ